MPGYRVGSDGMTVIDREGHPVISVVNGWQDDGGHTFAEVLCAMANGDACELPQVLAHHWKADCRSIGCTEAVIYRKAPIELSADQRSGSLAQFAGAYVWQAVARVSDHALAQTMADTVNQRLGWLHDQDGCWRHVIGNIALRVRAVESDWEITVNGNEVENSCPNAEAAKSVAEAFVTEKLPKASTTPSAIESVRTAGYGRPPV